MYWKDVLKEMGFVPAEEGSTCIYTNSNLGEFRFDFSSRQSTDSIAACIWDVAQQYGEKKMQTLVSRNLFQEF